MIKNKYLKPNWIRGTKIKKLLQPIINYCSYNIWLELTRTIEFF